MDNTLGLNRGEALTGTVTTEDVLTMAKTIYGEARGSTHLDRVAVGFVIVNRMKAAQAYKKTQGKAKHPLFGAGTIQSACLMPWQFSCWNQNDPNYSILTSLKWDEKLEKGDFRKCLLAALWVIEGISSDPTGGCLHYHHKAMDFPKSWGAKCKPDERIGAHFYYKHIE